MKCKDSWVLFPALAELYFILQNALELGGGHCSQVPKENALFQISSNSTMVSNYACPCTSCRRPQTYTLLPLLISLSTFLIPIIAAHLFPNASFKVSLNYFPSYLIHKHLMNTSYSSPSSISS